MYMLRYLGIGRRSKPASEEAIHKYKEQEDLRNQWKVDADAAKEIIAKLDAQYLSHEEDIFPVRYGRLKDMIKIAVNENEILKEKSHAKEAHRQREKYKEMKSSDSADFLKKGLKGSAQMFAQGIHTDKYKDLTEEDVEEDLKTFNKEVLEYKHEYRDIRNMLDKLKAQYEASKNLIPLDRYDEMEIMIKICCGYKLQEEEESDKDDENDEENN